MEQCRLVQKIGRLLIVFSEEERSEIRRLYCDEGNSMRMISFRFKVPPQIIKRTLVEMGVELRTLQESQQIRHDRELARHEKRVSENVGEVLDASLVSESKVIELYEVDKLLLNEIALKCSLTRWEVYEILKNADLMPDYSKK